MEKIIEVVDLKKTFITPMARRLVPALQGLSFHINKGKMVGFLGSNGSGKTTTLKILLGLIKKDSGTFKIIDKERIGFLTERPYFYEYLSGFEFLEFCSKLFNKNIPKSRITSLIEEVGLGHAAHRPLRNYSKGMLQRVGLAQALINEPELLILDEPMSGLDPDGRAHMMQLIDRAHKNGATVFFSTHLISDVEAFCNEVVIINHGKLVIQSPVEELLSKYSLGYELEKAKNGKSEKVLFGTDAELQLAIDQARADKATIVKVSILRPHLEAVFIKMSEAAKNIGESTR